MKDRIADIIARQYGHLGGDHAQQRQKLMASIPQAVPERPGLSAGDRARTIRDRIIKMKHISRIAAAILIVAVAAGAVALLTLSNGGASIAWADVQQYIRNARTMTYKTAMQMEGMPNADITTMLKEPGLMRIEMTFGNAKTISIMDIQQEKMIVLSGKQKTATLVDMTEMPAEVRKKHEERGFLADIKKLIEESETELGEKEIDGLAVKGYRVEKGHRVITIWADAETGQPVEINMTMFQGETEITVSDFELDVELDDSLFSVDVPPGYTVEKKMQLEFKEASVDDLVEMLHLWTKVRGGTFPDALTPAHFVKDAKDFGHGKHDELGIGKDNEFKVTQSLTRAMILITQHGEAIYAGKGVKLGDAETAIFWYKPKDSETYKVIYGDLSVKDVAEEDLPAVPDNPTGSQ